MQFLIAFTIVFIIPFTIIILLIVAIEFICGLFSSTRKMPDYNPNHPGITDQTIFGKKDIICPKCKSPYCRFHYETVSSEPTINTKTKVHLLNPFKPLVEETTTITQAPDITIKQYQCLSCGRIFI